MQTQHAMPATVSDCVRMRAAIAPDKVFWRQISASAVAATTFAELLGRASSFAHTYGQAGLEEGRPVLIFLPHGVEAVAAFLGAMLFGAIPSFMPCPSPKQHPSVYWPAHVSLLRRVGSHLLVTDRRHAAQMGEHGLATLAGGIVAVEDVPDDDRPFASHKTAPDDIALLQHSSGTTSLKKGVALSHSAILRQVELYADRLGMREADTIVSWLPLYHDMGLIACTIMPLVLGQTVTSLDPFEWAARPASLLHALDRYGGGFTWMPNFGFEHLVRAVPDDCAADLSRVRAFINCSEPCKADTFDRFHQRFAPLGVRHGQLQTCYAMAETVFAVSQTPVGEPPRAVRVDAERLRRDRVAADPPDGGRAARVLSTGRLLPGIEVRICNEGLALADNQVGEIVLRGDTVFSRYFNDPETTRARLTDGWYRTRDLGFTRDGELFVLGRQDDLLIINGRNLHAHEVEGLMAGVAGIKPGRAVAFGVFNEETGSEELVVIAERDPAAVPASDPQVSRRTREAVYDQTNIEVKVCRIVEPGWLVKTTSGKISREANRAKYLGEVASGPPDENGRRGTESETLRRVAQFIAARFKCLPGMIRRETTANDVEGWDSLAHANLILATEQEFGVRFADQDIFRFACVGDIADRIDELRAHGAASASNADRLVYQSDNASIMRLGDSDRPEIIVFAGREKQFGGLQMMEFSSVFAQTAAANTTKFFVTDRRQDWYTTCFDEVAARLNALSDKPKIIFGNSMGGYGALRLAAALRNVISVLSFVPQTSAPWEVIRAHRKPREFWQVRFVPGVHYCVVFGEAEDETPKALILDRITDPARQKMVIVPNCGHNLASYLNEEKLLARVIEACVRPQTMADEIQHIVSAIEPSAEALRKRAAQLARKNATAAVAPVAAARERPAPRVAAGVGNANETVAQRFARANLTGDGRLTRMQAKAAMPFVMHHFKAIDVQQKGYVTLQEVQRFWRAHAKALAQVRPQPEKASPEGRTPLAG